MATTFTLGDGNTMPAIGLGTFQIPDAEVDEPVATALKLGYKHIDTAEFYANEAGVGRALAASGVARESVFITSKLNPGNPNWGQTVKTYETTIEACKESVRKLGVDKIDLYLVHTPFSGKEARIEQWRALVECQRLGLCKSIGVSNYGIKHLQELTEAGLPTPSANQLELHPLCQKKELLEFMKANGKILPIAYSSLAPLSEWRDGYTAMAGSKDESAKADGTPSLVSEVASKLGVSAPRLLLRYALQKGWCILPKSVREERLKENFDLSFEIGVAEMERLDGLEADKALAFGSAGQPLDPTMAA